MIIPPLKEHSYLNQLFVGRFV